MDKVALNDVMQQLRTTANRLDQTHGAFSPKPATEVTPTDSGGFSNVLADAAKAVSQAQKTGAQGAAQVEAGTPGVALDDVMIQLQRADLSFRAMSEVRNKLVTAYQEIMNMPV